MSSMDLPLEVSGYLIADFSFFLLIARNRLQECS